MDDFDIVSYLMGNASANRGANSIHKVEIPTSGKTLNTNYTEALPEGWTTSTTAVLAVNYRVYGNVYPTISMAIDTGLNINVNLTSENQIQYNCIGRYTADGILEIYLCKTTSQTDNNRNDFTEDAGDELKTEAVG